MHTLPNALAQERIVFHFLQKGIASTQEEVNAFLLYLNHLNMGVEEKRLAYRKGINKHQ